MARAKEKTLNIRGTTLLQKTLNAKTRYVVHEGSARSSKSYSIAQALLIYCLSNTGKTISVCRRTLPALKATVLRDVREVFDQAGLWNDFNKTELTISVNGNLLEFFSLDDEMKVRGRKRDVLWLNEANEVDRQMFLQLDTRTIEKIYIDLNPSELACWCYDLADGIISPDVTHIHSTYADNSFLEESVIRAIESTKNTDPEYYKVFGLGLRGSSQLLIYPQFDVLTEMPEHLRDDKHETAIGVDFGWSHESAVVRTHFLSDGYIHEELVYEQHLDAEDLVLRIKSVANTDEICYCDAARPDVIDLMKRAGLNAVAASKDVYDGIQSVKRQKIRLLGQGLVKEFRQYRWKQDGNGNSTKDPVKIKDDLCDAVRYAVFNHTKRSRTHGSYDYSVVFV